MVRSCFACFDGHWCAAKSFVPGHSKHEQLAGVERTQILQPAAAMLGELARRRARLLLPLLLAGLALVPYKSTRFSETDASECSELLLASVCAGAQGQSLKTKLRRRLPHPPWQQGEANSTRHQ